MQALVIDVVRERVGDREHERRSRRRARRRSRRWRPGRTRGSRPSRRSVRRCAEQRDIGAATRQSAATKGRAQRNEVRASSIDGVTRPRIRRCGSDAMPAARQNSKAKRLTASAAANCRSLRREGRLEAALALERRQQRSLLPEQNRQRDQGGGEQHGVLDDLRQARRAHAGGEAAQEQHRGGDRDARSQASTAKRRVTMTPKPCSASASAGKEHKHHGEHGERPDARCRRTARRENPARYSRRTCGDKAQARAP